MTPEQVGQLQPGLYNITWKDKGGESLASVGILHDGSHWMAPSNWTNETKEGVTSTDWENVASAHLLFSRVKDIADQRLGL